MLTFYTVWVLLRNVSVFHISSHTDSHPCHVRKWSHCRGTTGALQVITVYANSTFFFSTLNTKESILSVKHAVDLNHLKSQNSANLSLICTAILTYIPHASHTPQRNMMVCYILVLGWGGRIFSFSSACVQIIRVFIATDWALTIRSIYEFSQRYIFYVRVFLKCLLW